MKSNKKYITSFIKRILESYVIEAEDKETKEKPTADTEKEEKPTDDNADEANPFAGSDKVGDDEKATDDKEDDKKPSTQSTGGIPIKFNFSAVKQYNNSKFLSDNGTVKSISKDGLVVTTQPDGVDVFVNFDDISEHVNKFFKKKK